MTAIMPEGNAHPQIVGMQTFNVRLVLSASVKTGMLTLQCCCLLTLLATSSGQRAALHQCNYSRLLCKNGPPQSQGPLTLSL